MMMTPNPIPSGRRSIRLKGYDYSQAGVYFITICAHNRLCLFGEIEKGRMALNRLGLLVQEDWRRISEHWPFVNLMEFCVMPNHLHGIIVVEDKERGEKGTINCALTEEEKIEAFGKSTKGSIPTIIKTFKAGVTRRAGKSMGEIYDQIWQRGYYEHVIRNEKELRNTVEYISMNPQNWDKDSENVR